MSDTNTNQRVTLPFNEASKLFTKCYKCLSYNTIYQNVVKHITRGGTLGFNPVTRWVADGRGKDSRKYKMLQHIFNTYDHDKIAAAFDEMVRIGKINTRFRDGGGRGHGGVDGQDVTIDDDVPQEVTDENDNTQEVPPQQTQHAQVDMNEVIRVARNTATARVNEMREQIASITRHITVHDVRTNETRDLGMQHEQFATLLQFISAGFPVWIPGPAGSGKTTAAMNVAKALDLDFHFNGAVDTEYKLLGFTDAGGRFHDTPFYRAYKAGGVYLFDEVDASNPQAMVALNAALENGQCVFGNGEHVIKHNDMHVIAAANTFGGGATHEYVGRNKLDAATVDRFVMLEWDYDEALERYIAQNQVCSTLTMDACNKWVDYVQKVRAIVRNNSSGIKHVVSPRASFRGAALLASGVDRETVIRATVRKGLSNDAWQTISRSL